MAKAHSTVSAKRFIREVADRAAIDPDRASAATAAVLETLGERISGGEVDDLANELPPELRGPLQRGNQESNGAARPLSLDEFVRAVAEREGVTPEQAFDHARAVFATMGSAVSEKEFRDMTAQLPKDYAALLARP